MTKKTTVVGIMGLAGAGKTTFGLKLRDAVEEAGSTACLRSFATPVKSITSNLIMALSAHSGVHMQGWDKSRPVAEGSNYTYRDALIAVGTDIGRQIDPNLWVKCMQNTIDTEGRRGIDVVVIDDVRFENEMKLCDVLVYLVHPNPESSPVHPKGHPEYVAQEWGFRLAAGQRPTTKNAYVMVATDRANHAAMISCLCARFAEQNNEPEVEFNIVTYSEESCIVPCTTGVVRTRTVDDGQVTWRCPDSLEDDIKGGLYGQ